MFPSIIIIIQPDCGFDADLLWFEVELHTFPNEINHEEQQLR